MSEVRGLRLSASAALKEKRLAALLAGRDPADPRLREAVEDAQVVGSLELAGTPYSPERVAAARRGDPAPPAVLALQQAQHAVPPKAPFSVAALVAWHRALFPDGGRLRSADRVRENGPPPAPSRFIASRLEILESWLNVESSRELKAPQAGALVLARVLEILPFDEGNGLVSRLAASHVMVRAGSRPPILTGADRAALDQALQAAFRLETEPLAALLEQATERALDVMIANL